MAEILYKGHVEKINKAVPFLADLIIFCVKNIISCILIFAGSFSCNGDKHSNSVKVEYNGQNRPKVHFTAEKNWMGVPGGFVYSEGKYHLFYEYNPDRPTWGNLQLGHAVSKDLVHWTHLPVAISSDSLGSIFSGCVIADFKNSSGFGTPDNTPLIAFYTQLNQKEIDKNENKPGLQSIAYSFDNGVTWIKYKENPVIIGSRYLSGPKVFWHTQTNKWIMCLADSDRINLYSSLDCLHWKYLSNFKGKKQANNTLWQYPDLFPLVVKGSNETKWVLLVNESQADVKFAPTIKYFIGDFDGQSFKVTQSETKKFNFWLNYGKDFLASMSCSNEPNNRRIIIGWMNCWQYAEQEPTVGWRGSATFPCELNLVKEDFLYLLKSSPVNEIRNLYGESKSITNFEVPKSSKFIFNKLPFNKIPTEIRLIFDISHQDWIGFPLSYGIKFQNSSGEYYAIKYENDFMNFNIDRAVKDNIESSDLFNLKYNITYRANGPTFEWRIILDSSSIEFFADNCKVSVTNTMFLSEPFQSIELFTERSPIRVVDCSITELRSICQEKRSNEFN